MKSANSRPFSMTWGTMLGLALVLAMVLCPGAATAQVVTTGGLSGTIVDPSGAAIPNATLTITNTAVGYTQTVTSNGAGVYTFADLQPATYQLRVSAKGFSDAVIPAVIVSAARMTNLRIDMKVGAATETVEVSGESQVLETTTNSLNMTISPEAIQNLPLNGRDALQFAELAPGATITGQERYTTVDDLPAASLNISVDGTNDNFQRFRSTTTGFFTAAPLRIGAFDEMTVSTNDLTSDAGAEGSTTLKYVVKRGTNKFHGNTFWEAQNSFFNANTYTNNATATPLPKSRLNDYGASLGGPFWKDKLFFFLNFEWNNQPGAFTDAAQVYATGANPGTGALGNAENGDFFYQTTGGGLASVNLLNLASANGLPSTVNSVSQGLISQINGFLNKGTLIGGSLSAAQGPGLCCQMPNTNTLLWAQPFLDKYRYPTARVDYQITPKMAIHESWDMQWWQLSGTPNYPGALQGNSWKATYFTTSSGWDWTITPHVINQFTFGTESTIEQFNPTTVGDPFAAQGDEVINPALGVNPVIPGFVLNQPRDNPLWNPVDNLTWTRGNHTFTFGGDVRISTSFETEVADPPTFSTGIVGTDPAINMFTQANFPGIDTSNNNQQLAAAESLYAFLVGRVSGVSGFNEVSSSTGQYQVEGRLINREKQVVGGIYFQDGWRMTPHLALNYGLRWQMSGGVHSTNNFWTSPDIQDLLGPSSGLFQPGVLNGDPNPVFNLHAHPYSGDHKEFAPNFGIAWNPDFSNGLLGKLFAGSKTVLRGGASISYYDEGWTTVENSFFTNPGSGQSVFLQPGNLSGQFAPGSLALGSNPTLNAFPTDFKTAFPLPESAFTFAGQNVDTIDPKIRSPYVESWNAGIQRQLPGGNLFEVDYVGNHVVHSWLQFDLNEVNIFENGFLNQFKTAQANLAANGGGTFADNTGNPGVVATPIFDAAFAGQAQEFTNSTFLNFLNTGQAGALAGAIAGNSTFFCNMVGAKFGPCGNSGGNFPINFFQANPFATGQIAQLLSDPGSSTYNALQLQWKHPTGHGLFLGASYTYSHGLTNRWLGDFFTSDEALQNFTTLRDPGLNKGPSPYDLRNQFKMYFTYDLPFGKNRQFRTGNSWVDNTIGGWTWGSVITAATGLPFKLMGGTNTFNYSFATQNNNFPDGSDSGVVLNGVTVSQLQSHVGVFPGPSGFVPTLAIDPAFLAAHPNAIEPESTPGQLGQFIYLKGPKSWDVDFSLKKSIPIYEQVQFNIYGEFLNAFNHAIWAMPGNTGGPGQPADYMNLSNSNFSALGLVNNPRTIEFRLQMAF